MLFLGTSFFSGLHTLDSPAAVMSIREVALQDGTYDHLYISKNPNMTTRDIDEGWDFDTVLSAGYDQYLDAGNSGFSLKNTDTIVLKVREKDSVEWTTIYTKEIITNEDFAVAFHDYYRKSDVDYEYMIISTINGIENSYAISEVHSEFGAMFILDKNNVYGTMYDLNGCDTTRNINASALELLNERFPAVISNGTANYDSGSVSGSFIKIDEATNTLDIHAGVEYRKQLISWLCNQKPKVLKFPDGRIWLIKITDRPADTVDEHMELRKVSFSWVEIGDVNDTRTMYLNNLSDVPKEWW